MTGKRLGLGALVLCTFVGIAGCSGEPTGPSKGLDIRFETDIIGDRTVPYVEVIPEGPSAGCERLHVGGYVVLYGSGHFDVRLDRWNDSCDGVQVGSIAVGLGKGSYDLDNDLLILHTEHGDVTAEFFPGAWQTDTTQYSYPKLRIESGGVTYQYIARTEPLDL